MTNKEADRVLAMEVSHLDSMRRDVDMLERDNVKLDTHAMD